MKPTLFEKVLIANRGEIAVRIIKTLKKMGIKSVAVYSESDTNSLHVQMADEAYYIGNSPATESYLSIKNIVAAARSSGPQAIHPGYGFLSENAHFATALKREGIVLIGPSASAIKKFGDKIEAKKIAIESGVSTVPGYVGIIKNHEHATAIAKELGFPVIVKAAAGGGGRGMRVVNNEDDMVRAFAAAKLEAESSFSDGRVFIEKFITNPRHIEIQLLADQYGNAICLGERECSIQRHHQKIIEEAPSPFLDTETRAMMYEQVISLAKKVGYYSAGTVEFIVGTDHNFYFLEINTRLQVEHTVTELVTGLDIVEEMIRIAAGEKLRITQDDVIIKGWAFESRIYAEDPTRGFLPSSGRITEYREPAKSSNIRIDSGIDSGGEVSMFYDPMIAKLCSYGETRIDAINHMKSALSTFVIRGIAHNMSFLEAIISNPRFIDGNINTDFIRQEYPDGFLGASLTSETTRVFLATAIHIFITEQKRACTIDDQIIDQVNRIGTRWIVYIDDAAYPVFIKQAESGFNIRNGQSKIYVRSNWLIGNKLFTGEVNDQKVNVKIDHISTGYELAHAGMKVKVFIRSPRMAELESMIPKIVHKEYKKELAAPLSGAIIAIEVAEGDSVIAGQNLIVLSAMKMENVIVAEQSGIVSKIHVKQGDHVSTGQILINLE